MSLAKFRKITKGGTSPQRNKNGQEETNSSPKKDNKSNG